MAMTLPAARLAAQGAQIRSPIVELMAGQFDESIPFKGNRLDELFTDEYGLSAILHSSGMICAAYLIKSDNKNIIKYVYSNTDRTEFNYADVEKWDPTLKDITMVELKGGNIGLVVTFTFTFIEAASYVLSPKGQLIEKRSIKGTKEAYAIGLLSRNQDYLMMFSQPATSVLPVIGGSYTSTSTLDYTITVTKDGTNTDSAFKYGSIHDDIPMNGGNAIPLDNGLTISFPAAYYFQGQEFYFTANRATYSTCSLEIKSFPKDGSTIEIAGQKYTFKETLQADEMGNQTPYEVKIDHQSKEITLENLNCAINTTTYDESGEGERYSKGTQKHPLIYAGRSRGSMLLNLTAVNFGNLTYPVILGNDLGIDMYNTNNTALTGGKDSSVSAVNTLPSCKTYITSSPDFRIWSTPEEYVLKGVVPVRDKGRYSFTKLTNGNILLWFDVITAGQNIVTAVSNIFYATSTDGGYSWSKANAITNYLTPQTVARDARGIEIADNQLTLAYQEVSGCMKINHSTQGMPTGLTVDEHLGGLIMNVDFVRRRAYISSTLQYQVLNAKDATNYILEVDIDEWRILKYWNKTTAPALPYCVTGVETSDTGDGFRVFDFDQTGFTKSSGRYNIIVQPHAYHVMVMDVVSNRIISLQFATWESPVNPHFKLQNNTTISGSSITSKHAPLGAWADDKHNKLWIVLGENPGTLNDECKNQEFASIDLTQVFDPANLRHEVSVATQLSNGKNGGKEETGLIAANYNEEENIWVFSWLNGVIKVIEGESWGQLYDINPTNCNNYPAKGLRDATYSQGKLYGGAYNSENEAKYSGIQGLCIIDLANRLCTYHVPPFVPESYYGELWIRKVCVTKDNKVLFTAADDSNGGVCVLYLDILKWTLINSSTVSGFTSPNIMSEMVMNVDYDAENGNIYVMQRNSWTAVGFQVVNIDGKTERLAYKKCTMDSQSVEMVFGESNLLVKGSAETAGHIFCDPNDSALYAFWQKRFGGYRKIYWDKEISGMNLDKYLVRGAEIAISKSIDGTPNTLSFQLSNGHMFDPTNTRSLMSTYLKKGKKVTLRIGENINNVKTYQTLPDYFVVIKSAFTFKRGDYPVITIECEDRRTLFNEIKITATPYYPGTSPEAVLKSLLQEHCKYTFANINLPEFDEDGAAIKGQFIDKSASEIIEDITARFGYFPTIAPGDIFTVRKINLDKAPEHIYSGAEWLVDYSPDDSFSDMTNKVTVTCESADKIAVLMPEELALQESGTIGWYKRKKTKRLYYSDDGTKTYLYPRMVKIETASSVAFKLAGSVKEFISGTDQDNNSYVDVAIEAPDLTNVFLSALAMILTAKLMPGVHNPDYPMLPPSQSKAAGLLECMGTWLAFQCVGAIANYQYEIYAQPIGYVRRSYEYSVTDDTLIRELNGAIIEKKLDNSLCYTAAHCQKVAEFEMMIAKAQRSRVKMTKITHLQDEPGDIVQINHPYNKLDQRIFITDLKRRILIPGIGAAQGHILDDIEGWKL